ncbi:uncharacterized protein [Clytia hemisphaerica]|uniref:uncharacterized protein n=1 Tax=Clytia hemisphaerica TaxID=252671 RepID=UPI0034D40B48
MILRAIALVVSTTLITAIPVPQFAPPMMGGMGMDMGFNGMMTAPEPPYQKTPNHPVVYAPLPGEIVFKLVEKWDEELTNHASPDYQILEGNIRSAVQNALHDPYAQVTNIYFREGQVPGNPPSRPKVVVHMMVNGKSDAASRLEESVTPDGTLGDGLKVFKDSFNAY